MKITRIETVRLEQYPKALWVQVHTDEGYVGLGETFYGARTAEAAIHELFASLLIGRDPRDIERHWTNMFRLSDHWGYGGAEMRAVSALDIALWDIAGQAAGRPIYEMLGGACRDRVAVYDTGGGPSWFTDPVPYATQLLDEGVTAMKVCGYPVLHQGEPYAADAKQLEAILRPIRTVADALGDRMRIAVDGHGFWGLNEATRLARALEGYPILWLEELTSPRNVESYLRLREATSHPICLAERFVTRYQFRPFIERGAVDVVMPDLVWTGGISETKKIAVLAETYQLPVAPHDCTGPVNLFACAHVCMNIPNAMLMETLRLFVDGWYAEVVTPSARIEDGYLLAPEGPGLGAQLRPEVFGRPDVRRAVSDQPGPHYMEWEQ